MYAIIETGGKQYKVETGDIVSVEKLGAEVGETVTFEKVLAISDDNGLQAGTPYLDTTVTGEVTENGKAKKVVVLKYKPKKDSKSKQGHRQPYTMVEIKEIGGKAPAKAAPAKAAPAEEPKAAEDKGVSASMKKEELIQYAKDHGIEIDAKAKKADIIDAINSAK